MKFSLAKPWVSSAKKSLHKDLDDAYRDFVAYYPEYNGDPDLDALRLKEFSRIKESQEVYVDYVNGSIAPESIIVKHADILRSEILGHPGLDSPSSRRAEMYANAARQATLDFFDGPPNEYVCIFTKDAKEALDLVAESYPFSERSSLVIPTDSSASLMSIRSYAHSAEAEIVYLDALEQGGFDEYNLREVIVERQVRRSSHQSLFALCGESEATGYRPNLKTLLSYAKAQGFDTLLDAETLAPTSRISLRDMEGTVDAMAITFHKMFGYPTGVGALIARRDFLARLKRLYHLMIQSDIIYGEGSSARDDTPFFERFESNSLHYQAFPAITHGIQFLDRHMPYLPQRLAALDHWLRESLSKLRYPNGAPLVRVLTGLPDRISPLKLPLRFHNTGPQTNLPSPVDSIPSTSSSYFEDCRGIRPETSSTGCSSASGAAIFTWGPSMSVAPRQKSQGTYGYILTCVFLTPLGERLAPAHISKSAARHKIHLSTSTACIYTFNGTRRSRSPDGSPVDGRVSEDSASSEIVVRMSLGMGSDFEDVWNVLRWAKDFLEEEVLEQELVSWRSASHANLLSRA